MIGANHLATGAVIAISIKNPIVVLPLAFVSHFVLDTFPHYGYKEKGFARALRHKLAYFVIAIELIFYPIIMYMLRHSGLLAYMAAFVAYSPDFVWMARYLLWERRHQQPPASLNGTLTRFHARIQWGERPWGLIVDLIWLSSMIYLLAKLT